MQQVAEVTGISKGNLTYHFPSKQALFEEVHREATAYVRDRLLARSFDEAADAIAGVSDFTRRLRRWLLDDAGRFVGCLFTNLAVETQHSDPAVANLARATLDELRNALAERLAAGQRRGEVRADLAPEPLSRSFFWMYEGALVLSRAMNDPAEYDAFRDHARAWLAP
jgi:AcrR family transcriptional regulator